MTRPTKQLPQPKLCPHGRSVMLCEECAKAAAVKQRVERAIERFEKRQGGSRYV